MTSEGLRISSSVELIRFGSKKKKEKKNLHLEPLIWISEITEPSL